MDIFWDFIIQPIINPLAMNIYTTLINFGCIKFLGKLQIEEENVPP